MKIKKCIISGILVIVAMGTGLFGSCATNDETVLPKQEINTIVTEESSNGIKLTAVKLLSSEYDDYGVAPTAESAYTLNVTYRPSYVTNADVSWKVEFVNPNSEWATGKTVTDYVTLSSDNKSATITVHKAFSEQIKITVSSVENPNLKASCVCDYVVAASAPEIKLVHTEHPERKIEFTLGDDELLAMENMQDRNERYTLTGTRTVNTEISYSEGTVRPDDDGLLQVWTSLAWFNSFYQKARDLGIGFDLAKVNNPNVFYRDTQTNTVKMLYSQGDDINIDLPFIDLLIPAYRDHIIQSRDYLWGITTDAPENWDDGTLYSIYVNAISQFLEDNNNSYIMGEIHYHIEGVRNSDEILYDYDKQLRWSLAWFDVPVASVSTDVVSFEF